MSAGRARSCPAPSARRARHAVPARVADEADDRVGCVVAPRSARAGADRRGDEVPAGLPRRRSRRRHDPPPAHAHVGAARHAAGEHRASPPARAPVRVRGSDLPDAAAVPAREKVSYQSMGILLAAAIVEKVSGEPMPGFMARTMFNPLGMRQTSFGLGGRLLADTAQCQVPEAERSDWDWNSPYWRNLASPWGGAHATARDSGRSWRPSHPRAATCCRRPRPRDARDPDRHAAATLRPGLAARAGRLRPDLLRGDVRPLRFDRHADLARSGHGHDLRRPHDQTGHGFQGQPSASRFRDHWTHERLMSR